MPTRGSVDRDRGQASFVVVMFLAASVLLLLAYGQVLTAAVDAHRARTAADASALAGAAADDATARYAAESNGARLLSIERRGAIVEVEVQVGRARRSAAAVLEVVPDQRSTAALP